MRNNCIQNTTNIYLTAHYVVNFFSKLSDKGEYAIYFQTEAGKLQLEGCLGEDYYKVRHLLYEQYAII